MDDTRDLEQESADAELVRRTLQGDDAAFEALVLRYKSLMIVVAYRQCRNDVDAEDAAQEALYRAYRQLGNLDDPARFKSWATRIAANAALDLVRRRKPVVSLDRQDVPSGDLAVSHNPGAPQELAMEEARLRIVEAIESLPEPYQLPAALRYLEDLSYRDMAERLGLREDALRKRIHRANTMLRQKLQDLLQD